MATGRGNVPSRWWREAATMSKEDIRNAEVPKSFIYKLHYSISNGLPHAIPASSLVVNERELVHGVVQMLQGYPSSLFIWNCETAQYQAKEGIYVLHLSQASLKEILKPFLFAGTCLKQVEIFIEKVDFCGPRAPTLSAFSYSVHSWLRIFREAVLREEEKIVSPEKSRFITLLALTSSFSSLYAGAEQLFQIVHRAVPNSFIDPAKPVPSCEIAVYILDHLFMMLSEVSLLEGGEDCSCSMLLTIFTGSLLPYLQGLDSWIYDGILDDPYEEMFFYANNLVSIDQPAFWETSYLFRQRSENTSSGRAYPIVTQKLLEPEKQAGFANSISQTDSDILCPVFMKGIAKAIVSAGKSLKLVQHVQEECQVFAGWNVANLGRSVENAISNEVLEESSSDQHKDNCRVMGVLTLSDIFLISLVGLLECGDHMYDFFRKSPTDLSSVMKICTDAMHFRHDKGNNISLDVCKKAWFKLLGDVIPEKQHFFATKEAQCFSSEHNQLRETDELSATASFEMRLCINLSQIGAPSMIMSRATLRGDSVPWEDLNIAKCFDLPPLNDQKLRDAILHDNCSAAKAGSEMPPEANAPSLEGTNYKIGFGSDDLQYLDHEGDKRTLEALYAFPTLLPCVNEDVSLSDIIPFQRDSTLASRVLKIVQGLKLQNSLHPVVIIQECLSAYVNLQVDHVGKHVLSKMMGDWRLMDELFILRSVYLLGSGDLLQHFLTVIFDRLDKKEHWDDEFELNTILQESVRNSSDSALISSQETLVVSIAKHEHDVSYEEERKKAPKNILSQGYGIDALDTLSFSYKISWPLDLIANKETLKKYNQVMGFLLKVKRAKFVLSKTRKWMWKGRKSHGNKRHLFLEQKLLHFVDVFHQYVMDRVYHSAWTELCVGMASAGSLDEVIDVHDAYLSSIQRLCFVASDKPPTHLIANRVKAILSLALDFYNVQHTLFIGGSTLAIKTRCEMQIDRIREEFDDKISRLSMILSKLPHLADLVTQINYNSYYR